MFPHINHPNYEWAISAEDLDPETREQWGNFVQTYSMAGIIDSAIRLSTTAREAG